MMSYYIKFQGNNYILLLALKQALVDMYIERLRERQHRKTIARDHGLITSKHKLTGKTFKACNLLRFQLRLSPSDECEPVNYYEILYNSAPDTTGTLVYIHQKENMAVKFQGKWEVSVN